MKAAFLLRLSLGAVAVVLAAAGAAAPQRTSQPVSPLLPPPNGISRVESSWHALTNATVHIRPGVHVDNATVLIRDGRIVAVHEAGEGDIPPGMTEWDCTGLQVYAGLIEPYLEVEAPAPARDAPGVHWNPRVTPQRTAMDGSRERGSPVDARTARSLRELGFTAAAASPQGGIFRGTSAVVSLADPGSDPSRPPVTVYRERVYQAVGFETGGGRGSREAAGREIERWPSYPNSQMGAIALIRQTLVDADWLQRGRQALGSSIEARAAAARAAGFDGPITALDALANAEDAAPLLFDVGDELEVLRASKIAAEFDRQCYILGSGMEFRRLDAIREQGRPLILPLNFPEAPKVESVGAADEVSLTALMNWEQAPTNVRRLDAAYGRGNISISLTTSKLPERGGRGGGGGRGSFMDNLRSAIRHGLSEERALAMLTVNPSVMLGVEHLMGTVEAGKVANLVVTDGPLFARGTKIRDVWVDGRRHEIMPASMKMDGRWIVTLDPPINDPITAIISTGEAGSGGGGGGRGGRGGSGGGGSARVEVRSTDDSGKEVTVSARNVRLDAIAGRLSFVFDHDRFGSPGVFMISGVLEGDELRGHGTRADGAMFTWSAVRSEEQVGGRRGATAGRSQDRDDDEPVNVPDRRVYPLGPYARDAVPPQQTVIIRGATIWTSGPQGIIPNGVLVMRQGKIHAISRGTDARGNPVRIEAPHDDMGVIEIDATGKHITPGLIDCHSHTGISKGVNESGQAVTAEVRIQDVTNPDSINWYRQLAGGVTTVNNLHGSANPIGGQNAVNKVRWGVPRADDMHFTRAPSGIKFALGENVKQSNWGDGNTTRYPQTRMGVEAIIRDRFIAARQYAQAWRRHEQSTTGASLPPRRDLELDALAEILAGDRLVHCHSYRQDEMLMLARVAQEFGFRIGTYQHALEGYKVADAVRESSIGASLFSDWWGYKVEVQDAIPHAGPLMHEVGVVVSYNSDSDELARRMHVEAAKAVKYSGGRVSEEEALKFITLNPARQLGIEKWVGSLEIGKDADVVLWSGPPLSSLSRCEAVWIDGRQYFSLADDAKMRQWNQQERQRILQKLLSEGRRSRQGRQTDEAGEEPADAPAPTVADDPPPEVWAAMEMRGGGRRSLLFDAVQQANAQRREAFLDLLRRGIDPEAARCGDCGMFMLEKEAW